MGHPAQRHEPLGIIRPASLSLGEALDQWDKYLAGKSRAEATRRQYQELWNRVRDELGWVGIDQINKRELQAWMATQRKEAGGTWSGNTHDHAGVAFRSFGTYLEVSELLERNPLRHLESCGDADDEGARAATTMEARGMIEAALARTINNRKAKGNRPLYWLCMFHMGLRWSDPHRILVRDTRLNDDTPGIVLSPRRQKNKKRQWIPVRMDLAEILREWIAVQKLGPDDHLMKVQPNQTSWHEDREHAGIALEDEHGLGFKSHSARKWFATTLDETGCTAAERHKLLRHADGTADRYARPDQERLAKKVEALPPLYPKELRVSIGKNSTFCSLSSCNVPKKGYSDLATPMLSKPSNTMQSDRFSNAETSGVATERPYQGRRSDSLVLENGPRGESPAQFGAVSGPSDVAVRSSHSVMPITGCKDSEPDRVAKAVERILAMNEACLNLLLKGAGHGASL
jgi:integrase